MDFFLVVILLICVLIVIGSVLGLAAFLKARAHADAIDQLRSKIEQIETTLNRITQTSIQQNPDDATQNESVTTPIKADLSDSITEPSSETSTATSWDQSNDIASPDPARLDKSHSQQDKNIERSSERKPEETPILSTRQVTSDAEKQKMTLMHDVDKKIVKFFTSVATNWMAWLGGTCIAIAGIFLAKYSIEQGLIGPTMRILLGVLTGIGLHIAAYRLYKKSGSHISLAAMAGGGSITLFATLLASLHFYEMFSPMVVFVLLALVAITTMWLAVLHGPALAVIGMLGAYVVPILVSTGSGNLIAAMLYALIITTSVLLLVRTVKIDWLWYGAVMGGFAWWFLSLSSGQPDGFRGIYLALLAYLLFAISSGNYRLTEVITGAIWPRHSNDKNSSENNSKEPWVAQIPLIVLGLVGAYLFSLINIDWLEHWKSFLLLPALLLFVSGYQQRLVGLIWMLLLGTIGVIVFSHLSSSQVFGGPNYDLATQTNDLIFSFISLAVLFIGFAVKNYRMAMHRAWWSAITALTPILLMLSAYLLAASEEDSASWALGVILVGVINMAIAWRFLKDETHRWLTVWHILAGNFAYAVAVYITFENTALTLAFAAQIFSVAWLIRRFNVIEIAWLLKVVVAIVVIRLTLNPFLLDYPNLLHWPIWTYGATTLICYLSSLQLKAHSSVRRWIEVATLHLFTLTAWTEARYFLHGGNVFQDDYNFIEATLYVGLFGVLSIVYHLRANLSESMRKWYRGYSYLLLVGTILNYIVIVGSLLVSGDWALDNISETPVLNTLTLALGLPVVIAILFSRYHEARFHRPAKVAIGLSGFIFVTFQIRHLWQGTPSLDLPTSDAELYTYSIVWLVTAVIAMLVGGWRTSQNIYKAGLIFLAVVICKIFLVDMDGLDGLYRVASFMGLGLALVGISFLHQKLKPETPKTADPKPEP